MDPAFFNGLYRLKLQEKVNSLGSLDNDLLFRDLPAEITLHYTSTPLPGA